MTGTAKHNQKYPKKPCGCSAPTHMCKQCAPELFFPAKVKIDWSECFPNLIGADELFKDVCCADMLSSNPSICDCEDGIK